MNKKNKNTLIILILITALTFILILTGLKIILGNRISSQNIFALLGFSFILGIVSSLFYLFQLRWAHYIFNLGILIGLIEMYRSFFKDLNGWGDLTGLTSLFFWCGRRDLHSCSQRSHLPSCACTTGLDHLAKNHSQWFS